MTSTTIEPLYIVDGSGFIFRAYYGIRAPMSAKDGTPTNAVYGFVRLLMNAIRDRKAKNLLVVFDPPGPTFRNEIFDQYKANRDAPPEDLIPQFALCREAVTKLNIPCLEVSGYEADDVIATVAKIWSERSDEHTCVIITADKDLCQLVNPKVSLWDGKEKETDAQGVVEKFGVGPELVIDVLGLAGDTSDNIPGVPGIGVKTAATLLNTYGSLDKLLDSAQTIKGKRGQNLVEFREQAILSRTLATIVTDVPVGDVPESYRLMAPEGGPLADFFRRLNFRRFLEEFELSESSEPKLSIDRSGDQLVVTQEQFRSVLQSITRTGKFAFDLETTSLNPLEATIVGIGLAWAPGNAAYVPVGHSCGEQLELSDVLDGLRPLLENRDIQLYGQNLKYDLKVLKAQHGIDDIHIYRDSMISAYLLDPGRRQLGLDQLALENFGHTTIKFADVLKDSAATNFSEVPLERAAPYACEDADIALRLGLHYDASLSDLGLRPLERDIELPLIEVLARMELQGIRVNPETLHAQSADVKARAEILRREIMTLAGEEFNPDSPKQLSYILFEKLGLPEVKKTKTGQSTDSQVLQTLALEHPIAMKILDYRQLVKLANTYLDTLPGLIHPSTGRVHTQFRQAVTATGRLSSSDPNLQNIPIRTPDGRRVREAFIPADGCVLISADYSQIELRLLAHYSDDPGLVDAFVQGADIHRRTAAQVFGVKESEVTSEQRRQAKSVNFGLMYGMSAFRLSNELGILQSDARRLIKRYFEQYSGVKRYFETAIEDARQNQKATTLYGRTRTLAHINSRVFSLRQQSERLAINTPIQGSAADILKVAMIQIDRRLRSQQYSAKMLLTVHDELVFECPKEHADEVVALVKHEMENAGELKVPLIVQVGVGESWAQIH